MNKWQILLDIGMALVIAAIVFAAVKQGFVKSFFKYMKMTIVIILTMIIGANLIGACETYIVADRLDGKVSDALVQRVESSGEDISFDSLADYIPEAVKRFIPTSKLEKYFDSLSGSSVEIAQKLGTKIESVASELLAKIIAYFGTFVIVYILCSIGVAVLEKFCEIPVFKGINKFMGFIWGLSHAYVCVSTLVCLVLIVFSNDFIEGTFLTRLIYKFGLFTH